MATDKVESSNPRTCSDVPRRRRRASRSDLPGPLARGFFLFLALSALVALAVMAALHPFGPVLPAALALAYGALLWRWPQAWLALVPALLPVIDQTKTSGAIFLADSDLLLTATLAMGYARLATRSVALDGFNPKAARLTFLPAVLLGLLTLSYAIAAVRGFLPYAPFDEQPGGYDNRWNSLRVAKGFFFPLALLPLLIHDLREKGRAALNGFLMGTVLGLAGICFVAIQERLAYTGLTDFAANYRITGPFWEMHVGGAALDGWLALTLPFLILALFRARNWFHLAPLIFLCACAGYVSLVTFSRGVYGAILVIPLVLLIFPASPKASRGEIRPLALFAMAAAAAILAWLSRTIFHTGGYRALAAFLVLAAATHFAPTAIRGCRVIGLVTALPVALAVVALNLALAMLVDKGAYLAFGWDVAVMIWGAAWWRRRPSAPRGGMILGLWVALALGGALVAWHWGGAPAANDFAYGAALLAAVLASGCLAVRPIWPWNPRVGALTLAGAGMLAAGVAVGAGYFMGERLSQSRGDLAAREEHWRQGISWLHGAGDWTFGKGLGRFPDAFYWNGPQNAAPGTFHISRHDPAFMSLTSAHHPLSWGDMLRLEQAISWLPSRPLKLQIEARAPEDVSLYLEVCARHLIYALDCHIATVVVKGGNAWRSLEAELPADGGENGGWYAPRRAVFAFALASSGRTMDVAKLRLLADSGADLLRNGDFSAGGDYWFFSSDRDHIPWHIKSVPLNALFDQGLFGLAASTLLLVAAVFRAVRRNNTWPEAPYFLASLAGFATVGLFDSLIDSPRLATLYYLTCFLLLVAVPERFAQSANEPSPSTAR